MPENDDTLPTAGTTIQNIDIRWLADHIKRMAMEVGYSQSAAWPSGLTPADRTRLLDFVADGRRRLEYAISSPIPDLPEAHGRYNVAIPGFYEPEGPDGKAPRSPDDIENDDLGNLQRQLEVYWIELVHSQSVILVMGLIQTPAGQPSDVVRMRDGITRIENLVTYIGATQPSDLPESTPRELPVPAGR